jgi:hypothetical protein
VGSGPLASKVGDGGTHPGGMAPVRAERMTAWWRSMDAEALWPAPMAPEVPTIPEGEGRVRRGSIRTRSRARVECTEEGKIGSDGGLGSGEEWQRCGHWRGLEAEREGCLWCASEGEWRRGKWGAAASGSALFMGHSGKQRKGGWGVCGAAQCVEGGEWGGLVPIDRCLDAARAGGTALSEQGSIGGLSRMDPGQQREGEGEERSGACGLA